MRGAARRGDFLVLGLLAALCVAAALAAFLVESADSRSHADDAYISYRYARNLAAGHGLVYNPGEYVEGFTNLLWTLLVALGIWMGADAPEVSRILSLACGIGVLVATATLARDASRPTWSAALAPWIVLSSASFVVWSNSGMETPLFVLAVTGALAADLREKNGLTAAFLAVAVLTRPDGILVAAAIFAVRLLRGDLRTTRDWLPPLAVGAVLVLLSSFRLAYYGSLLPNTFHAKVGGIPITRGLEYAVEFLATGTFFLLYPAARAISADRRLWTVAAFALITLAYVVAVGGDVFPNSRFLLPTLPALVALAARDVGSHSQPRDGREVLALACYIAAPIALALGPIPGAIAIATGAAMAIARQMRAAVRMWPLVLPSIALLAVALAAPSLMPRTWEPWNPLQPLASGHRAQIIQKDRRQKLGFENRLRRLADDILSVEPKVELVAAGGIGIVGYYSEVPIVDYWGLVTQQVAQAPKRGDEEGRLMLPGHQSSNADYVLSRRPDYIMISKKVVPHVDLPAVRDILGHPDLQRDYEWRRQPLPGYWRRSQDWKLSGIERIPGSDAWFIPGKRPPREPPADRQPHPRQPAPDQR
jgi:arabinofuranosyltransferase